MEEEQLQVYNSDSNEEQVDLDQLSIDMNGPHASGWIQWYAALEGNQFLLQIEQEYIRDAFNLVGLVKQLNILLAMNSHTTGQPYRKMTKERFKKCLNMILSPISPNHEDLADDGFLELNHEAGELYGLIHSRYVFSVRGMARIYAKFLAAGYGYCPRTLCDKQKVLPVGISDIPKTARFKVFCPRCEEVYVPKCRANNVDGAWFGTSFPHVFLKNYPNVVILPPKVYLYEPQIAGFKIYGKRGSKFHKPCTEESHGTVTVT